MLLISIKGISENKHFVRFSLGFAFAMLLGIVVMSVNRYFFEPNKVHISQEEKTQGKYYSFTTNYPPVYDVKDYDVVSRLEIFPVFDAGKRSHTFHWKNQNVEVGWNDVSKKIEISSIKGELINLDVDEVVKRAKSYLKNTPGASKFSIPQEILTLWKENDHIKAKIYFDDISIEEATDSSIFHHFKSDVFLKFKNL